MGVVTRRSFFPNAGCTWSEQAVVDVHISVLVRSGFILYLPVDEWWTSGGRVVEKRWRRLEE